MTAEEVKIWACENETELVLLDDLDEAIEGIISEGLPHVKVVYSKEKAIEIFRSYDMTEEEAWDHFEYNTLRSLPYMGDAAPVFMET